MYRFFIIFAAFTFATSVAAANFKSYENGRFGYVTDLPTDFKKVLIPENGDGVGLESADGSAKLSVWGSYLSEGGFRQESDRRQKYETTDGWQFVYERHGASWTSLSGTKGERIVYIRQIALCDDAIGNFRLEYPASQQKKFRPIIDRMVTTLMARNRCDSE